MQALLRRLEAGTAITAGVLSGTSGDGIDVALARCEARRGESGLRLWSLAPLAFETLPFPTELAPRVRSALDGGALGPRELALLSRDLGWAFGRAARALARRHALELDLVGSHGQTVWHHDGREPAGRATLQLGDGDFVAEAAGCAVVSDFRQRDVACGGEGAPIAALADDLLFATEPRPLAILNLGGMANLTWLGGASEGVRSLDPGLLSFDTGPAGSLLDGLARRLLDRPFDAGGACALGGRAHERLVAELMSHPFFAAPPPKSTGRDTFGEAWVDRVVERAEALGVCGAGRPPSDLFASAVELVARSIAEAIAAHLGARRPHVLAAGGGVHNLALLQALRRHLGSALDTSAAAGIDPDAREALAFAVLAARCVLGEPVTSPSATGAAEGRCLGKISPAAR